MFRWCSGVEEISKRLDDEAPPFIRVDWFGKAILGLEIRRARLRYVVRGSMVWRRRVEGWELRSHFEFRLSTVGRTRKVGLCEEVFPSKKPFLEQDLT
jgi:hypothetical protein